MTPTPQPTPGPDSGVGPGGIVLTLPQATGTAKGSKYGLGSWGAEAINPGDLPFLTSLLAEGKTPTGDDIVKAFAHANPEQIATIQHAMLMGGHYYQNKSFLPQYGIISGPDIAAFASAVQTAGKSGMAVSDLLERSAAYGAAAGVAQAQQQQQAAAKATITLPNTQDLEALATKAAQAVLGHKAKPEEIAGFAAMYRAMVAAQQRSQNQQRYDAHTPALPGALANTDPSKLVGDATTNPDIQGAQRVGGAHGDEGVRDVKTVTPAEPMPFSDQVGNLMSLGQAVASAQQAGQPVTGLTQYTQDATESPDVAAENYFRNLHPDQAAGSDTANTFNVFLGLLRKNFG